MTDKSNLCDDERIRLLVADQLPEDAASEAAAHLSGCARCREKLDSYAGDRTWWSEVETCLRASSAELSRVGSSAVPDLPLTKSSDEDHAFNADFAVSFLEPCDQPSTLGRIDEYEISEVIGRGGMGIVLKGLQRDLGRYVAVKVMAPHLATSGAARQRFIREARAAAAIVHPHVMPIHAVNADA